MFHIYVAEPTRHTHKKNMTLILHCNYRKKNIVLYIHIFKVELKILFLNYWKIQKFNPPNNHYIMLYIILKYIHMLRNSTYYIYVSDCCMYITTPESFHVLLCCTFARLRFRIWSTGYLACAVSTEWTPWMGDWLDDLKTVWRVIRGRFYCRQCAGRVL